MDLDLVKKFKICKLLAFTKYITADGVSKEVSRMLSSIKTEGALKLRCAENLPMQRGSSCLILTIQSRIWLMFELWTTEY